MKKETKYVAPEAEILSAQVEKGFQASPGSGSTGGNEDIEGGGWM